jgi:cathepsin B
MSDVNITIPEHYNFLDAYPQCDFGPLSQECGCCYAYGPIKVMSHRFCRALGRQVLLSSQYVVACDIADNECVGGCERSVFYFMEQHGITDVDCHPWRDQRRYNGTFCASCLTNESLKRYYAKYGSTAHYVGIEDIQKAILLEGPVSASIASDWRFTIYDGGIYTSSLKGKIEAGNHAVELVGWGKENDVPYWILLNQYGRRWGEKGRMRIRMGTNEGLIESFVYAADPVID